MENKIHERYEVVFALDANSRKLLRDSIVNKFLEEEKGYWEENVQHVTAYKYYVETISDGRRVYLLRPTFLNKGIDFQVWVERMIDGKDKKPSHKDVFSDLQIKRNENPGEFHALLEAVNKVWNCEEPDAVLAGNTLNFNQGFPVDLLLKVLKWLFIEQDVTYWNYDGRAMLKAGIDEEFSSS